MPQSRYQGQAAQSIKRTILKATKKKGGAAWEEARGYEELWEWASSGEEFRGFLMDPAHGLGYPAATAGMARRMISALKLCPERTLWERLGWQGGVATIESIPNAVERQVVHDKVLEKLGRGGRGKWTQGMLKAIVAEHAPSKEVRDAHAHQNAQAAKLREAEELLKHYRKDVRKITRNIPQARQTLSDAVKEDLAQTQRAQRARRTG